MEPQKSQFSPLGPNGEIPEDRLKHMGEQKSLYSMGLIDLEDHLTPEGKTFDEWKADREAAAKKPVEGKAPKKTRRKKA